MVWCRSTCASELATNLHGVVQIHLCQRGDASCSHVSHSCEVGAEGSEEEGEEGEELGLQGRVNGGGHNLQHL